MIDQSLAQPAHRTTTHDQLAERLERELSRIRRLRPALADRCDRAADLLVTHLASPSRVIRVRIGAGGRIRFLVSSLNDRGAIYTVNPRDWRCSCPDAHRRDAACKHGIACFALTQATAPKTECPPCRGDGKVWIGEQIEDPDTGDPDTGEAMERLVGVTCRRCGGSGVL